MTDYALLEQAIDDFITEYAITAPPIAVDEILNKPLPGMWDKVDLSQLTLSFSVRGDRYAPRVSIAKLLVRQLINSPWGVQRNLPELIGQDAAVILAFTRMLLVPRVLLQKMPQASWHPVEIASDFFVPEDDAEGRLALLK